MDEFSTEYRVLPCSKCSGDTEYFCESCICDLCQKCKVDHIKDLKTTMHWQMIYRESCLIIKKKKELSSQFNRWLFPYYEDSSFNDYGYYFYRKELEEYKTKRRQLGRILNKIMDEALFYSPVILQDINADIKTCLGEFTLVQSKLIKNAQIIKDFIDMGIRKVGINHRCFNQMRRMRKRIAIMQKYEFMYEKSTTTPVQLLLSKKETFLNKIHLTLHTSKLSMTQSLNKKNVMTSLIEINISERRKRHVRSERLLEMRYIPKFINSFAVKVVNGCSHVSCLTSNKICVSDGMNILLTNTQGDTLYHLENLHNKSDGIHTANSESDFIFIEGNDSIKKYKKNTNTITTFIKKTEFKLRPWCVYLSPSTEDLLVGMYSDSTGKVARYNRTGQLTQSIQHDSTGLDLYVEPNYITENHNGDVVVSNIYHGSLSGSVVVTDHAGRHRFSYTGHLSEVKLRPHGICTDVLSQILVCDEKTNSIHILDSGGQFLSHLFIRPSGVFKPHSLGYDINTHCLFVGSLYNNRICAYRYLTRQNALPGKSFLSSFTQMKYIFFSKTYAQSRGFNPSKRHP